MLMDNRLIAFGSFGLCRVAPSLSCCSCETCNVTPTARCGVCGVLHSTLTTPRGRGWDCMGADGHRADEAIREQEGSQEDSHREEAGGAGAVHGGPADGGVLGLVVPGDVQHMITAGGGGHSVPNPPKPHPPSGTSQQRTYKSQKIPATALEERADPRSSASIRLRT